MKRFIYYITLFGLLLASCTYEDSPENQSTEKHGTTFRFSVDIPDYKTILSRATGSENTVNDLWLMAFDADGLFIGRVHPSLLIGYDSGVGAFQAEIPDNTGIVHLIANYDQWDSFDERAALQKDERELIPSFTSTKMVFWGRQVLASASDSPHIILYRNQAKVTVENEADNFEVTGYAICNYASSGTAAPFNPDAAVTPFVIIDGKPTLAHGSTPKASQTSDDCTMEPKYMFENENYFNDQTYIIISGRLKGKTDVLYYKIQLLDSNKKPYSIVRNYHYRVVIKSFSENANGSTTFDDAKSAESSNNIYAEIFKDSPTIADNNNNVLTVSRLHFLFVRGGTLNVSAQYTQNGVTDNSKISVVLAEDQGNILRNLSYDGNGTITTDVSRIIAGQQGATITVKAGVLSRTITVVSSELYQFAPASLSPEVYTARDQDMTLQFTIPANIPSYLYPLKCTITTANLYPVAPNKNLQIEYTDGGYQYVYWATEPGTKILNFRTSLENSDETILIANDIFKTQEIEVKSRHFTDVAVNGSNLVNYGINSTAQVMFAVPSYPDYPVTYPLTVFIATEKLHTTQSGWTAVEGGYQHTYASQPSGIQTITFTSVNAISDENIVISAPGFSPTTIGVGTVLSHGVAVTNTIRVYQNNYLLQIPNYRVTSSDTSIVPTFTVNSRSNYSFTIAAGSKASDVVRFTLQGYTAAYRVEELLQHPAIVLK
ncbi:hypothetical protein [Bacteroides faecium]|uniref:DUF4906 domain-containing protein n=1 Tax=Bacteroides faecium TaxID=2715212 RepID=A0A6H0KR38_9BACE|nr:hypothetical protein [Bacteroides faecium]QIU95491.1 hypothetical protein BacF7301_15615 [Bacteroides faecium]